MRPSRRAALRVTILLILCGLFCAVWFTPLRDHLTREEIRGVVAGVRSAWYGPLLLIVLYAAGSIVAIPASLFIIAAGAIWGWALGGTYALAGGVLGAMGTFAVGRFVGGRSSAVSRSAAEERLRNAGFRSLLILRLLPIFPFAVLNYAAGIVRVDTFAFLASTALGLIPSNFVFAWSADEIFNGSLSGGAVLMRLAAVAAIAIVAVATPTIVLRLLQRRRRAT